MHHGRKTARSCAYFMAGGNSPADMNSEDDLQCEKFWDFLRWPALYCQHNF